MIRISEYATLPTLDLRGGIALGAAMVSAVQESAPETVKVSARAVHAATAALQADWAVREKVETKDRRPVDNRNDRAWSAFESSLSAALTLSATPRGVAAAKVYPLLFKEGLAFTQLPFAKQWAEGARRIKLIEEEGLAADVLTACGGPEYLNEVRASHEQYGVVLNITEPASQSAAVNLADALSRLRDALYVHVSQVIAWGNQDVANEAPARNALKPIDTRREQDAARASGQTPPEPDVSPETPLPPAP